TQFRLQIERASLDGQIATLDAELRDYEALRAGQVSVLRVDSLAGLPDALVRARIGSGLTQRELAERLGVKEQQVQRYEAEDYAGASLARLHEVMCALGVELQAGLELPAREMPLTRLRQRLTLLGLNRHFIDERLLRDAPENPSSAKVLELAERAARLFDLPVQRILSGDARLGDLATSARFKTAKNTATTPLDAYTRYAESIADIVLRATRHLVPQAPPGSAREMRAAIEERVPLIAPDVENPLVRSDVLYAATLRYIYDLQIPVVPLRDSGAFHGACFTRDGRSVIVLKQMVDSSARWLNDLLHEVDHLQDPDRGELRTWIELGDISEWSEAPEERHANDFAADVLFSGRAEPVLTRCLQAAQDSVQRLKAVVPQIAQQADVPVDVLANHLAFRLSARGVNWWATAATFQEHTTPWRHAADLLLIRLDLASLDAIDRAALVDALAT
ncbi:MAG: helix-turn-helix domain-containing protein, partial [Pseudonocardiaceae bacterium]